MNGGSSPNSKIFLILWFAFLQCVIIYGAVVFIIKMPEKKLPLDDISFLTIAASLAAAPHLLGRIYQLRKNFSMAFYIIRLAIAETAAMFGLMMYLIFGCSGLSLKAIGIGLLSVIFLFPLRFLRKTDTGDPNRPPPIE